MIKLGSEIEEKIDRMIKAEIYSAGEIIKATGVPRATIYKRMQIFEEERAAEWLKEKWEWKDAERCRARLLIDKKYRKVKKGDRGSLRTPYRPDGMWR